MTKNGKEYNKEGELLFKIQNGKGKIKEYNFFGYLIFEGRYLNGERNWKGKEYYWFNDDKNSKENIKREKEMEKEKNIIQVVK